MTDQFSRRQFVALLACLGVVGSPAAAFAAKAKPAADPAAAPPAQPAAPANLRLAVIVPSQEEAFFKAGLDGIREAAAQLGTIDVLVASPAKHTAREQVALVNDFVKQKVDALVIAPIDAKTLGPATRRALARGIKVVSFARELPVGTRLAHVDGTSAGARASTFMTLLGEELKEGGEVAILAGARNGEDGQALVSQTMRQWLKPAYAKLKLVETVFGNDDAKAASAAADKLVADHPDLKGILVFNQDALAGAAASVADKGLAGKVSVTGFGQPSTLKAAMDAKAVQAFASINPADLGYGAAQIAVALARQKASGDVGSVIAAGRLGDITLGERNVAALPPVIVDEANFARFADLY